MCVGEKLKKRNDRAFWCTRKSRKKEKAAIACENRKNVTLLRKREMAIMYLTMFDSVEKVATSELMIDPGSLYRAFEQVTDGRKAKGKRYPMPLLLTLLML